MIRGFILGIIATLGIGLAIGYIAIVNGALPANADAKPSSFERWAARMSLRATVRREASTYPNPLRATDANLISGVHLYMQNCSVCHGGFDGKKPTKIARGLYQRAPQLAEDGVEDDPPGVVYWKIQHGIRLTGMPSFGKSLTGKQLWQLAAFLGKMDKLPPAAQREWKKVGAKS
ncbi:MAG: cytochrome c [Candidatus Eremiobacteraeota bacterium]|nr:cytochrome c [Candidatus Eremiobacteraeota bacterium]